MCTSKPVFDPLRMRVQPTCAATAAPSALETRVRIDIDKRARERDGSADVEVVLAPIGGRPTDRYRPIFRQGRPRAPPGDHAGHRSALLLISCGRIRDRMRTRPTAFSGLGRPPRAGAPAPRTRARPSFL